MDFVHQLVSPVSTPNPCEAEDDCIKGAVRESIIKEREFYNSLSIRSLIDLDRERRGVRQLGDKIHATPSTMI